MNKTLTLLALCFLAIAAKAQTAQMPVNQDYGKVSKEDLELQKCDFEKDANAEVLFNKADQYFDPSFNVCVDYHKRIKVFNDHGKDAANIKIEFLSIDNFEYITGLQAETINQENGKTEIIKIDKKQIFLQAIDRYRSAMVFSMPNVKAGSIIEFKYTLTTKAWNIPVFYFQGTLPVRYCEVNTSFPEYFYYSPQSNVYVPYAIDKKTYGTGSHGPDTYSINNEKRVMMNVPSVNDEPFMTAYRDNMLHIAFILASFKPPFGMVLNLDNTWPKICEKLVSDEDFGAQCRKRLAKEDELISKANTLKTVDEKIAFLFNQVKSIMKWNGDDEWYTTNGTSRAWDAKTGNSTEINLILYHLLKKAGLDAMPMVVSTRKNGKVNPAYPYLYQFNRGIVYIPVDSTHNYYLDASNKYNLYNEIPYDILNSEGLYVNTDNRLGDLVFVQKTTPNRKSVFVNAEISPDGKMTGTAHISNYSYFKIDNTEAYIKDGEQKFIEALKDGDNNLKISDLKTENLDVDTLPMTQNMKFDLDLASSGDGYIYFNPNMFTAMRTNPFLSEIRTTNIDMGSHNDVALGGIYKIPAGYAINVLPKNISMTTPDNSITFRRILGEQDGAVAVRYIITYKKSIFFKENYADFHEFFKKMYEMLNEPVVLKKS